MKKKLIRSQEQLSRQLAWFTYSTLHAAIHALACMGVCMDDACMGVCMAACTSVCMAECTDACIQLRVFFPNECPGLCGHRPRHL